MDKNYPLELYDLESDAEKIVNGAFFCAKCSRFYPVIDEIPVMLPDELRNKDEDLRFLQKWRDKLPDKIINNGRPWHL